MCASSRLVRLLALLTAALVLAGCGGGSSNRAATSTPDPAPLPDPGQGPVVPVSYWVLATAGNGGSISPASLMVDRGTATTFTVTADNGYGIATVSGCAGSLSGTNYTTGAITGACTVTANFVVTLQPPTNVRAEPGDRTVTLSWTPTPGAQRYNVYWSTNPGIHPYTAASYSGFKAGVASPHTIAGLANGQDHFFVITSAVDDVESLASEEVRAQPMSGFIVSHPYSGIDWENYERHKASLHVHTRMSDGEADPEDVIDQYHALGYTVLSITDHDTIGAASTTWPWTAYGRDPASLGMVAIEGNEISRPHHIGSYYNDYGDADESSAERAIAEIGRRNGLAILLHPGRYSYPISWYVDLYRNHSHLIGLEIFNQGDRYPNDRETWDAVLTAIIDERYVWGFSNDDMHRTDSELGYNWNVLLMPELTDQHVRESLIKGAFFFVYSPHGHRGPPPPEVRSIAIDAASGIISIDVIGHERIDWISEGVSIHAGDRFHLSEFPSVGRYVRALIHAADSDAVVGTQPFHLQRR